MKEFIDAYFFILENLHGFARYTFIAQNILFAIFIIAFIIGVFKIIKESINLKIK